jgi:hypothetical protein
MNEHNHERIRDEPDLIRGSVADSDRQLWAGQRRLSSAQWIGFALMFIVASVVATSSGFRAFSVVFGSLILFVLLGHMLARRKTRPRR